LAYLKTTAKRAGGMAQMVKCLPNKHEALSSNSSTAKKQNKIKKQRLRGIEKSKEAEIEGMFYLNMFYLFLMFK
jgi:hypothetical protein